MFSKTAIAFSVAIIFGVGSAAQAMSGSSKVRAAKAAQSYGQVVRSDGRRHSSNPAFDVYDTRGWYVGSDPDPTIRADLARGTLRD